MEKAICATIKVWCSNSNAMLQEIVMYQKIVNISNIMIILDELLPISIEMIPIL
uniref:Uncharacterized protein n=1 Tax=Physcomitrium patens TaxID=3218 RepID=A0A2K1J196_PHYPA|nr:hypothetical protein PHYPA_023199 [Physcomitrium patens]